MRRVGGENINYVKSRLVTKIFGCIPALKDGVLADLRDKNVTNYIDII